MTGVNVPVGVGTRFLYDGNLFEVAEMWTTAAGNEVVPRAAGGRRGVIHVSLRELFASERARVVPNASGPSSDDAHDPASVVLAGLADSEREAVLERAAHIREVLSGYRSGSAELAGAGEPRAHFAPQEPLTKRYEAKAAELGVSTRTIQQWVAAFHDDGEAGLARRNARRNRPLGMVDDRRAEAALDVMKDHKDQSRPSRTMVIDHANANVVARFGQDAVRIPSRATAFRVLAELERWQPTFRLSTKRNRDIAGRRSEVYGKLRPTRPGEYLLMDTTRLDVFALDPLTLRWVQAELTVAMDWYTR